MNHLGVLRERAASCDDRGGRRRLTTEEREQHDGELAEEEIEAEVEERPW